MKSKFYLKASVISCIYILFFSYGLFAQEPPVLDFQKMEQEVKKAQQAQLENLKDINPKLYKELIEAQARQEKISAIIMDLNNKKISQSSAESQLYPLVKDDMQQEISGLDQRIKQLEQNLDFLKEAKSDPDILIKKRINQMTGKEMPSPTDMAM